jgi:ABC-type amino acid transport substrate-binding protein
MMKRSLIVLLAVTLLVSFASLAMAKSSIYDEVKKKGVVSIGHGTDVPPLSMIDPKDGELKGFDIEIAKAMVEHIGKIMGKDLKMEGVVVNNKTRIAFLANRRIDLTIRSMSHTRSRDAQIDYAEPPYLWTGKIFYAKKGRFKTPMDSYPGLQCLYRRTGIPEREGMQ